jgi:hypothetical protein
MVWVMFWLWNILVAASAPGQPGRMADVLGSDRFCYALFVEARSAWHGLFLHSCREITTAGTKRVGSVMGGPPFIVRKSCAAAHKAGRFFQQSSQSDAARAGAAGSRDWSLALEIQGEQPFQDLFARQGRRERHRWRRCRAFCGRGRAKRGARCQGLTSGIGPIRVRAGNSMAAMADVKARGCRAEINPLPAWHRNLQPLDTVWRLNAASVSGLTWCSMPSASL